MKFLIVALVLLVATCYYGSAVDIVDIPDLLDGNFEAFDEVLEQNEEEFLPWRPRVLTLGKCKKMIHAQCTKYSHLYKLLQCLWEKWYCEGVISNGVCYNKGRPYIDGQMIKKDCNKCQCVITSESKLGSFVCTQEICATTTRKPATTMGPGYCVHQGKKYRNGKDLKQDCNTCTCVAMPGHIGSFACTRKACLGVTTTRPATTVKKLGYCFHEGKKYVDGEKITKDCNTCTCKAMAGKVGTFACTGTLCTGFCFHNGKKYNHGEKIRKDCNTCTCRALKPGQAGSFRCTNILCPGFCFHQGTMWKNGEGFRKDCNLCTCHAMPNHVGTLFCTNKLCGVTPPLHPTTTIPRTTAAKRASGAVVTESSNIAPTHDRVKTDGKLMTTATPITPMSLGRCFYRGKVYRRGQRVMKACNTCKCVVKAGESYGIFRCTMKKCPVFTVRPSTVIVTRTMKPRTKEPTRPKLITVAPTKMHVETAKPKVVTKIITMHPNTVKPTTEAKKHECYYILRKNCYIDKKESIFRCFWNKWFCKSGRLPGHYKRAAIPKRK